MAGDQGEALGAGVQVEAPQHRPDAVLGDPDPAPLRPGELGRDPPRPEAGVAEREGDDPELEVRADLVRHPRPPALADPQAVEAVASSFGFQRVVGGATHPHLPAGLRDVAELLGQGEEPQAVAEQHVIMGHLVLLRVIDWKPRAESE